MKMTFRNSGSALYGPIASARSALRPKNLKMYEIKAQKIQDYPLTRSPYKEPYKFRLIKNSTKY